MKIIESPIIRNSLLALLAHSTQSPWMHRAVLNIAVAHQAGREVEDADITTHIKRDYTETQVNAAKIRLGLLSQKSESEIVLRIRALNYIFQTVSDWFMLDDKPNAIASHERKNIKGKVREAIATIERNWNERNSYNGNITPEDISLIITGDKDALYKMHIPTSIPIRLALATYLTGGGIGKLEGLPPDDQFTNNLGHYFGLGSEYTLKDMLTAIKEVVGLDTTDKARDYGL